MNKVVYWNLYENGVFIDSFPSHTKAKRAMHWKIVEANADMLDLTYEIKKADDMPEPDKNVVPKWKKAGFNSLHEYNEWLNDSYDDIRGGFV